MEGFVLKSADGVVTVAMSHVRDLKKFFPFLDEIYVIRNGYDPADFKQTSPFKFPKFTFLHAGSVFGSRINRFIEFLFALKEFKESTDFQVVILGSIDRKILDLIERLDLSKLVKIERTKPHKEAIRWILGADVLLLVTAGEHIPTMKLYEYLASGNFILHIGYSWGEAGKLISKYHAGISVPPKRREITDAIRDIIHGNLLQNSKSTKIRNIEEISWPRLAKKFALILKDISR
ncbi:MAG: hypothetical protein DRO00_09115 [Thermoproteota archaeon]|nr:MAG: hypothetical protein DRO00_09115 [Candidatus Korarchaeota archaeon]